MGIVITMETIFANTKFNTYHVYIWCLNDMQPSLYFFADIEVPKQARIVSCYLKVKVQIIIAFNNG